MKIFIDTANVEHIIASSRLGVVDGVTTNPSLIAKEGKDLVSTIQEILKIIDGPISAEVKEADVDTMYQEAKWYAAMNKNIVIKVPMTVDGIQLTKKLSSENIKTNVTLVFSSSQALLAAKAGATYVSPFMGRLDDATGTNHAGYELIAEIAEIFEYYDYPTQIIAASIRHVEHVRQALLAGSHVATIPYKVLLEMYQHELTTKGLEIFAKAAK